MRFWITLIAALATCLAMLLVRHHRRRAESFRACTMWAIYREIIEELPKMKFSRAPLLLLAGLIAVASAFYPVLLVVMMRWISPTQTPGRSALYVLGGLAICAGAIVNFFFIILSHMNFAFGTPNTVRDQTVFTWMIPALQALAGIFSIAIGVSGGLARHCSGWLAH